MFQGYQVADWGFVVIMSMIHGRLRRTVATLLVFVAMSLAGAACGGGGDDEEADLPSSSALSTTTTTESTTTTLNETDQKIEAAKAGWLAYAEAATRAAAEPVMPHLPEMQAAMTGDFQIEITGNLEEMQARGEAARVPANTQRSMDFLDARLQPDGSVQLTVCEVNDDVVYNIATGAIVNDRVATATVDVTMVLDAGSWKVSAAPYRNLHEGAGTCAG
jgi:hypothetical protein